MGPYFDQMKYCRSQTKFENFIKYCSHLLLEYLIKNNNDIRSLGHKNGNYF